MVVSIHAPAKGATQATPFLIRQTCFNPRAREGRDKRMNTRRALVFSFNPRAREGRDTGFY